jgi:hypothetical protein
MLDAIVAPCRCRSCPSSPSATSRSAARRSRTATSTSARPTAPLPPRDGVHGSSPVLSSLSEPERDPRRAGVPRDGRGDRTTTRRDRDLRRPASVLRTTSAPLLEACGPAGVWAARVYGYADLVDDPQVRHNGSFVEYDHPTEGHVKTPGFPIRFEDAFAWSNAGAPLEGQHTREILREAGFDTKSVARLLAAAIVSETLALITQTPPRREASHVSDVEFSQQGSVAVITLNRPEEAQHRHAEMAAEIELVCERCNTDDVDPRGHPHRRRREGVLRRQRRPRPRQLRLGRGVPQPCRLLRRRSARSSSR